MQADDVSAPIGDVLWDTKGLSEESLKNAVSKRSSERHEPFCPDTKHCRAWKYPPDDDSNISFGDGTMAATIDSYGDLVHFGRYLSAGAKSGMYSACPIDTPDVSHVGDRVKILEGFGHKSDMCQLYLDNFYGTKPSDLSFVHYRWPRLDFEVHDFAVTTQWLVIGGILVQKWIIKNLSDEATNVQYGVSRQVTIHSLEAVPTTEEDYCDTILGPGNYSLLFGRQQAAENSNEQTEMMEGACIVVSVFQDGNALAFHSEDTPWTHRLGSVNARNNCMEVTIAYRLMCLPGNTALPWETFLLSADAVDVDKFLRDEPFDEISLSTITLDTPNEDANNRDGANDEDRDPQKNNVQVHEREAAGSVLADPEKMPENTCINHIEFAVRRHLEHILGVCAITFMNGDVSQVALTCGNIASHRIYTPSSYFAFKFLVQVYKRLNKLAKSDSRHVCDLTGRISRVLKGHIAWVLNAERTTVAIFGANYTTSGKLVPNLDEFPWLPKDSLTDTCFQISKFAECFKLFEADKVIDDADSKINRLSNSWLDELKKRDPRKQNAWPRKNDRGALAFRLDDHFLIWQTLRDLESRKIWGLGDKSNQHRKDPAKDGHIYASQDVRKRILRHFTTSNDVHERMISVTRSSRESRFLLHARDTIFFYDENSAFFQPSQSLWHNTLEAQRLHTDSEETTWDNSVRYALAILMGVHQHRLTTKSPAELVCASVSTLFRSSDSSGSFRGLLDETSKKRDALYSDAYRDCYFHACFEIPYVLLTHVTGIEKAFLSPKAKEGNDPGGISSERAITSNKTTQRRPSMIGGSSPDRNKEDTQKNQPAIKAGTGQKPSSLKKRMPFNDFIKSNSIVSMEEEWLYNYPSFLSWGGNLKITDVGQLDKVFGDITQDGLECFQKNEKSQSENAQPQESQSQEARLEEKNVFEFRKQQTHSGFIIDIPKQKHRSKHSKHADQDGEKGNDSSINMTAELMPEDKLWSRLNEPRTAEEAKKRLIWLERGSSSTALMCYLCSPEDEKLPISAFFDHHANYENHFHDSTNRVLNTWVTEVHMSFFKMFDGEKRDLQSNGIPKAETQTISTNSIGASGRTLRLTRAAMGFRFVGDIFDRYWTCHFIEYIPRTTGNSSSSSNGIITTIENLKLDFELTPNLGSWRQRKVLELHFMLRILDQLVNDTKELRNVVREKLGVEETFVDITLLNSGDYFSLSTQWQQLHQVLQSVEDELDSVKANVTERWESREDDRGQEKPRWTTNDERKYRSIINTLEAKIGNRMRDMWRARDSVHSLKIRLEHMQDQTRNDLSLRGAENIRFFTYVTVVFLPLGFAVSIFSMADTAPGHHMLVNMAVCAVVALALTTIALVNAKTMAAVAEDMSYTIFRRTRAAMRRSSLGRHYLGRKAGRRDGQPDEGGNKNSKDQGETPGSENEEELRPPRRPPLRSTVDQPWHLWFWLAYSFVEYPARQIQLACQAIKNNEPGMQEVLHILLGLLIAPFFAISWLLQIAVCNIVDMTCYLWGTFILVTFDRVTFDDAKKGKFPPDDKDIARFMYPPKNMRPMKTLRDDIREQLTKKEGKEPEEEGQYAEPSDRLNNGKGPAMDETIVAVVEV